MPSAPQVPYSGLATVAPETQQPNDYLRVQASPQDFGSQVGGALQQAGQAAESTASRVNDVAIQYAEQYNNHVSDQGYNTAAQFGHEVLYGNGKPGDPNEHGFLSTEGADAMSGAGPAMQAIEQKRQEILATMPNDRAKLLFDQQTRRLNLMMSDQIGSHADQQFRVYGQKTQQATQDIALSGIAANPTSDVNFNYQLERSTFAATAAAHARGESPEGVYAAQLDARRKAFATRADSLAATDPAGALRYATAHQDELGVAYPALVERLKPRVNRMQGDAAGDAAFSSATGGAATTGTLSSDLPTFVKAQEGFSATPYADGAQTSIGYGTKAQPGDTSITMAEAERRLQGELAQSASSVDAAASRAGITLNPNQRNALISFDYNTGAGANVIAQAGGDASKLPALMAPYVRQGDKVLPSLQARRAAEGQMFGRPVGGGDLSTPISDTATPASSAVDERQAPGYPDDEKAMAVIGGLPEEQQARALSRYQQRKHAYLTATGQQRAAMTSAISNTIAGLTNGVDVDVPAETDIRRLYPPEKADEIMTSLGQAQQFNLVRRSVDLASPQDLSDMRQQLADGTGLLPRLLSVAGKSTPSGGAPTQQPGWMPGPEGLAQKIRLQNLFETVVAKRNEDLAKDPAMFVGRDPAVMAASQAVDPKDPSTLDAYVRASLAAQQRLGVPQSQQRILPAARVQQIADQLASVDPAKGDAAQTLDGMAKQFGSNWNQAFGELVRYGHISPTYQVLGGMTDPSQAVARQDLQRVLTLSAQKGGLENLKKDVPPDALKAVESGLDATIDPFRSAYAFNPGGVNLIANVRSATEHLATYYAMQGATASDALTRAYNGVIANRWDIGGPDGTMIAPKGQLTDVRNAAMTMQGQLKPTDLAPIPDTTTGLRTPDEQRAMALDLARNASWRPNADASGLVLIGNGREGSKIPIRRADGSLVEIKFGALPKPGPVPYALDPQVPTAAVAP